MDYWTPVLIGIGLSMDCLAVSLAVGTTTKTRLLSAAVIIAASFGIFQAGMTILGWFAGSSFISMISAYNHWIAFLLLLFIGVKMIWEGFADNADKVPIEVIRFLPVLILSVATSIDALAVGVSFGVLNTAIVIPSLIIGIVTFILSFCGVMLGERLEKILGSKTEIAGGPILILIGIRILVVHVAG
jgi:putative Mn2+ efflux pump MntP